MKRNIIRENGYSMAAAAPALLVLAFFICSAASAYGLDYEAKINEAGLPYSTVHTFNLYSSTNQSVNAYYGKFLSGSTSISLRAGKAYPFDVAISIPTGTVPGNYTSDINLSNGMFFTFAFWVSEEPVDFSAETDRGLYGLGETAYISLYAPNRTEVILNITTPKGEENFKTTISGTQAVMAYVPKYEGEYTFRAYFSYKDHKGLSVSNFSAYNALRCSFDLQPAVVQGSKLRLKAEVKGGKPPYKYSWSIDKSKVSGEKPEYAFTETGTSRVILSVSDSNSITTKCEDTIAVNEKRTSITISISDNETKRAIGDAEVTIDDGEKTKSNINGKAIFTSVSYGLHDIGIKRDGYYSRTKRINVSSDKALEISLERIPPDEKKIPKISIKSPTDSEIISKDIYKASFEVVSDSKIEYCWLMARKEGLHGYKISDSIENQSSGTKAFSMDMEFASNGIYGIVVECANKEGIGRSREIGITVSGIKEAEQAGRSDENPQLASSTAKQAAGNGAGGTDTDRYDDFIKKIDDAKAKIAAGDEKIRSAAEALEIIDSLDRYREEAEGLKKRAIDTGRLKISENDRNTELGKIKARLGEISKEATVDLKVVMSGRYEQDMSDDEKEEAVLSAARQYLHYQGYGNNEKATGSYSKNLLRLQESAEFGSEYDIIEAKLADGSRKDYTIIRKRADITDGIENSGELSVLEMFPESIAGSSTRMMILSANEMINQSSAIRILIESGGNGEIKAGQDEKQEAPGSISYAFTYIFEKRLRTQDIEDIRSVLISEPERNTGNLITGFAAFSGGGYGSGGIISFLVLIIVLSSTGYVLVYKNDNLKKHAALRMRSMGRSIKANMSSIAPRTKRSSLIRLIDMTLDLIRLNEMHEALSRYPSIIDLYTASPKETQEKLRPIITYLMDEMNLFQLSRTISSAYEHMVSGNHDKALECYDRAEELYFMLPDECKERAASKISNMRMSFELGSRPQGIAPKGGHTGDGTYNVDDGLFG